MALIFEDGTGRADADSYCSVADADAYLAARGRNATWATLNYSGASSSLWTPQTVSAASWSAQSPGATVWTPQ